MEKITKRERLERGLDRRLPMMQIDVRIYDELEKHAKNVHHMKLHWYLEKVILDHFKTIK